MVILKIKIKDRDRDLCPSLVWTDEQNYQNKGCEINLYDTVCVSPTLYSCFVVHAKMDSRNLYLCYDDFARRGLSMVEVRPCDVTSDAHLPL